VRPRAAPWLASGPSRESAVEWTYAKALSSKSVRRMGPDMGVVATRGLLCRCSDACRPIDCDSARSKWRECGMHGGPRRRTLSLNASVPQRPRIEAYFEMMICMHPYVPRQWQQDLGTISLPTFYQPPSVSLGVWRRWTEVEGKLL
jgi:hypothetical protein